MITSDVPRITLARGERGYPSELERLPSPPEILRVAGALPSLERAVAIVGTRNPDPEARELAHDLACDLAGAGVVVISGGARGIDAAAHEGALAAGGRTIAVLATGLSVPYPRNHGPLFARIAEDGGALVCEHDEPTPHAGRFLQRNRIIAALSRAVVVVQAPTRSGALNTAGWANELAIPVFAVPYAPWDARGEGCVALLARGARVCTRARDVLSVAAPEPGDPFETRVGSHEKKRDYSDLDADGRRVLAIVGPRARHVDEIAQRAAIPVERAQRALLGLLLLGAVEEHGASRYRACGSRTR